MTEQPFPPGASIEVDVEEHMMAFSAMNIQQDEPTTTTITLKPERIWWKPWTWFKRSRTIAFKAHVVDVQQMTSPDDEGIVTGKITMKIGEEE